MRVARTLLAVYCLIAAAIAYANPCTEKFGIDEWADRYKKGLQVRSTTLAEIRSCVAAAPGSAMKFNAIALASLRVANGKNELTEEQRVSFVRYAASLLWALAESNDATAQHNLAVLHNAQADTVEYRAIKQEQPIFMYWTRKAAAQEELQALFNLAMRFSRGVPAIGMTPNRDDAYKLFRHLERVDRDTNGMLKQFMSLVSAEKQKLSDALGASRVLSLDNEPIDFAKLAPIGPLSGTYWNSEENIRDAVKQVYTLVAARDETGAWTTLQRCYADALGLRSYMKAHESCIAFDIANTQWLLWRYLHSGESGGKPLPKQYEKDAYLNRLLAAFLHAGVTESEASNRILKIADIVGRETEKIPQAMRKLAKANE